MNNFEKNITFVIVSFKSSHIIEKCIQSINSNIKIIVVENSDDVLVKKHLENKFLNVEVVIAKQNLGYGNGNNLGISKVKTQYVFILNPDTVLEKNCLNELSKAQTNLKDNFTILAPNLLNNYGYFLSKKNNSQNEILEVDYGKGNNLGISKVKTQYAFILNPDAILEKNCLNELLKAQTNLKDNFTILAPNLSNNYGYFSNKNNNSQNEILEVDYVKGFAILINLNKIKFDKIFDENFFLFLEEIDLCKRIKDSGGKIFVALNSKIQHAGKHSSEYNFNIELCRNWHWMWSLFYYNYKHSGVLFAYKITVGKLFSSIFKLFIALIFFKKKIF